MGLPPPTEGRVLDPGDQMVPTVGNSRLRVTQPVMAFYTGMPRDAKCIFSASATEKDARPLEHVLPPRRTEVWNGGRIKAEAAILRGSHLEEARGVVRPERWEDLWKYFDAHDLYFRGSWNLWQLVDQLCAENEEQAMDDYDPSMAAEIEDWVWKWLTWGQNREKLSKWDSSTDILSVFTKEDHDEVGTTELVVLNIVRRELKGWHRQYDCKAQSSAKRQLTTSAGRDHVASGKYTKADKLAVSKTYESPGTNNSPAALVSSVPRSSSALESHTQASQTQVSPVPASTVTAEGRDGNTAAASDAKPHHQAVRNPQTTTTPTKQSPPKGPKGNPSVSRDGWVPTNMDSLHGPVMQHTSNAARAGSINHNQPKTSCMRRDSDCRNKDKGGKGTFLFCPCQYCRFQAHCVFVSTRDRNMAELSPEEFRQVSDFFGQWGQVEGLFIRATRSLLVKYTAESSVQAAIKWGNGKPLPPLTKSLYVAYPYLPKYCKPQPVVAWKPSPPPRPQPQTPGPPRTPSGPMTMGPGYIPGLGYIFGPVPCSFPPVIPQYGGDRMANNMSRSVVGPMMSRTNAGYSHGNFNFNAPQQPMSGVLQPRSMSMPLMNMPMPMPFGPQGPQHQGRVDSSQLMPGSGFQFPSNQVVPTGPPAGPSLAGPSSSHQVPVSVYQGPPQPGFFAPPQDWDATVTGQYYPPAIPFAPMAEPQPAYPPAAPMEPSMDGYYTSQPFNQQQTGRYGHLDPLARSFPEDATKNVPTVAQHVSAVKSVFAHVAQPESESATIYNAAANEYEQAYPMGQSSDLESCDGMTPVDATNDHDNIGTVIHHKSKGHYGLPSEWRVPDDSNALASGNDGLPAVHPVLPPEMTALSPAQLPSTASGTSQAGNKKKKGIRNSSNKNKKAFSAAVVDTSTTHAAHGSSQAGAQTNVEAKAKKPKNDKGKAKAIAKDIDREDSNGPAEVVQPLRLADWPRDPVPTTPFVLGGEADDEFEVPPQKGYRANAGGSLAVGRNRKKKPHAKTVFAPMPEENVTAPIVQAESSGSEKVPDGKATVSVEAVPLIVVIPPSPMIDVSPSTVDIPVSDLDSSPPSSVVEQGNEVQGDDTTNEAITEAQDGNGHQTVPVPGWPNGIFPFPEGPSRHLSLGSVLDPPPMDRYLQVITVQPVSRPSVSHAHRASEHSITMSEYFSAQSRVGSSSSESSSDGNEAFYSPPEVPASPTTPRITRVPSINVIAATPVSSRAQTEEEK